MVRRISGKLDTVNVTFNFRLAGHKLFCIITVNSNNTFQLLVMIMEQISLQIDPPSSSRILPEDKSREHSTSGLGSTVSSCAEQEFIIWIPTENKGFL